VRLYVENMTTSILACIARERCRAEVGSDGSGGRKHFTALACREEDNDEVRGHAYESAWRSTCYSWLVLGEHWLFSGVDKEKDRWNVMARSNMWRMWL
jgi:hypothetical protein